LIKFANGRFANGGAIPHRGSVPIPGFGTYSRVEYPFPGEPFRHLSVRKIAEKARSGQDVLFLSFGSIFDAYSKKKGLILFNRQIKIGNSHITHNPHLYKSASPPACPSFSGNEMSRLFQKSFCCIVLLVFCTPALASIQVGDTIRFQNGPGSPGGEFGIAHAASPTITEFLTFCVEKNEYINFSSDFYVESIETFANNGGVGGATGNQDPVDARTAWLYYNFRNQTLANYTFGDVNNFSSNREDSANALQNAVWFLENEQDSAGSGAAFVAAANAEWNEYINNALTYSGNMLDAINSVRIMNLRWGNATGQFAQSQLFMTPEPGTITIWAGLGLLGVFGYRRSKSS
jgi:hypothetical protein